VLEKGVGMKKALVGRNNLDLKDVNLVLLEYNRFLGVENNVSGDKAVEIFLQKQSYDRDMARGGKFYRNNSKSNILDSEWIIMIRNVFNAMKRAICNIIVRR
jgi:hypothetical protein